MNRDVTRHLGDAFVEQVLERFPVTEAPSRYGHQVAFWLGEREIAHIEPGDRLDLRLTRTRIRQRRDELAADDRVELRSGLSDWVTLRCLRADDASWVIGLIDDAVTANASGDLA